MLHVAQEFSQKAAEDTQLYQKAAICHSLVPGMSQYGESDVDNSVGTAVERRWPHVGHLDRSEGGLMFYQATLTELPTALRSHFSDGSQESSN